MALYINGGLTKAFTSGSVNYASSGYVELFEAGTSTHKNGYPTITDAMAGTNPYTWPVPLNGDGQAVIAIAGPTDAYCYDENNNLLWSVLGLDQSSSDITDSDGNILIHFIGTTNAVNGFSVQNAATGSGPILSAYGTDVNINTYITSKNAGDLHLDGGATGKVLLGNTSTGNIELRRATTATQTLTVTGALTASSTLGVSGTSTLQDVTINGTLTLSGNGNINIIPPGCIMQYGGTSVPTGWLECNGAAVSRTTYANLFTNISTTWGSGDGSTTFTLPAFARRTLVGRGGSGTGTLGNSVGNTGGAETTTLLAANIPAGIPLASGAFSTQAVQSGASTNVPGFGGTWSSNGSATAFNILQPSAVTMFIIKY